MASDTMTADITVLKPISKLNIITVEEFNLILQAEEMLVSPDVEVYEKYLGDIKAIVEKLPITHHKYLCKWFCPIAFKYSIVNRELYNRRQTTIGRLMGLENVWNWHYIDPHMQETVVIQTWNDPKTAIDDKKLVREYYRNVIKGAKTYDDKGNLVDVDPKTTLMAAKQLEASHDSTRKKAPTTLNIGGDVKGDVIAGSVSKTIIDHPDAIPGFLDMGVKEKLKAAQKMIEQTQDPTLRYPEDYEDGREDLDSNAPYEDMTDEESAQIEREDRNAGENYDKLMQDREKKK